MNKYALLSEQKPATITTKDWQFYETAILKSRDNLGKILKEYKESGTWKEKYKSWGAACLPFSVSKSWANELILAEVGGAAATRPNRSNKKEEAALKKVESARTEEPETPAVHSADEKAETNGHTKAPTPPKSDNGKPKTQLAVWREIEETLIGRAINRVDELNRQCPNAKLHDTLIACLKECLDLLAEWKGQVK